MRLAFPLELRLQKPSDLDKKADRERFLDAVSDAIDSNVPVEMDLPVIRKLPAFLRDNDFSARVIITCGKEQLHVASIGGSSCYGIAVDIGTTNIVASLHDLKTGSKIEIKEAVNPQTAVAPDVLSRIHESMRGRGKELHRILISGINDLILQLCNDNEISTDDVFALTIAGNTIMTHYFLDLPVENIPMAPYIPAAHQPAFFDPAEINLSVNPRCSAYVFPNSGSYVGGDIIAGIVASGLHKSNEPSLLIDVGTNVELVLGCDEWIIVGAGAAGPALEGDIAGIGMRAEEGAIYEFSSAEDKSSKLNFKSIGDAEPAGVCGSGMIELIAELFSNKIIDQRGKLSLSTDNPAVRITASGDDKEFVIYEKGEKRLAITENEIENFLRSKAALFASIYVLVKSVGLHFGDLHRIYVCGSFGAHINADKAVSIGMLPDIDRSRFVVLGNSSLAGAEMLLNDRELLPEIERVTSYITYREMNTDGEFQREFPAAMFLPHTNPQLLKA